MKGDTVLSCMAILCEEMGINVNQWMLRIGCFCLRLQAGKLDGDEDTDCKPNFILVLFMVCHANRNLLLIMLLLMICGDVETNPGPESQINKMLNEFPI
jgi:hypothetical protein